MTNWVTSSALRPTERMRLKTSSLRSWLHVNAKEVGPQCRSQSEA